MCLLRGMNQIIKHRDGGLLWSIIERFLAAALLVVLAPLLIMIALAIRVESSGPVIFKQGRPGWRGTEFTAFKFRSMRTGSELATRLGVRHGDTRITRVGAFLRKSKLDELPQLWSIARGDMRFVGPRPIPHTLDEELRKSIPRFAERYAVRPGLTSLAQICVSDNGLDENLVPDWTQRFEAERRYIRNRCFEYDLVVIAMTVMFVARKVVR